MGPVNRRRFLSLLGASAAAATVSACGENGTGTVPGGAPGRTSATRNAGEENPSTTLTFWSNHPGDSRPVEERLIADFRNAHPDVGVDLVDAGETYEDVAQRLRDTLAGESPDGDDIPDVVLVSDVTWSGFALEDQLTPLDELFDEAGVDTDGYVDTLLADYIIEGRSYGLPYARSTPLFFYNKPRWDEAGLPDRGPESWEEFLDWAPRIQDVLRGDERVIAMYTGSNYLDWTMQNMVWDAGGAYSRGWEATFTDPDTIAGVEMLKQINDEGFLTVATDPVAPFSAGSAACAVASTGLLNAATENSRFPFGASFLPGAEADSSCPTGGAGLAIPAAIPEERKLHALRLIDSLTSTQGTAIFARATGYMPVRENARAAEEVRAYLAETPAAGTAIDQLEYTRAQDYARVFVPGGGARIGSALDRVLAGDGVAETMARLQAETQQIIDTELKPRFG